MDHNLSYPPEPAAGLPTRNSRDLSVETPRELYSRAAVSDAYVADEVHSYQEQDCRPESHLLDEGLGTENLPSKGFKITDSLVVCASPGTVKKMPEGT